MSQTTIQKTGAIKKGSVRLQIGADFNTLIDLGAIRDPKLMSLVEPQNIEFDNANDLRQFAEGDKYQLTATLAEIDFTNLQKLDDGMVNITTVAASPVTVTAEAKGTGWTVGKPIKLNYKNGANTVVASIVVKAAGTPLTLTTNYVIYVGDGSNGELGATYIVPVTASAAVITADYSYTPNASKKITFNKFGTKTLYVLRITNTDASGKVFKIDMNNVTNVQAPSIDFAGDDEADIAVMPITLEGYIVEKVDEQSLT